MKNENILEVINEGKIPEDITPNSNSKAVSKSFKLSAEENKRLEQDFKRSGCKSLTDYIKQMLFGQNRIVTIDGGLEILRTLSECADLLSNTAHDRDILGKFEKVEKDITRIFDWISMYEKRMNSEEVTENGNS